MYLHPGHALPTTLQALAFATPISLGKGPMCSSLLREEGCHLADPSRQHLGQVGTEWSGKWPVKTSKRHLASLSLFPSLLFHSRQMRSHGEFLSTLHCEGLSVWTSEKRKVAILLSLNPAHCTQLETQGRSSSKEKWIDIESKDLGISLKAKWNKNRLNRLQSKNQDSISPSFSWIGYALGQWSASHGLPLCWWMSLPIIALGALLGFLALVMTSSPIFLDNLG